MTDHLSILRAVFQTLDESQRLAFLQEVTGSLSASAKHQLLLTISAETHLTNNHARVNNQVKTLPDEWIENRASLLENTDDIPLKTIAYTSSEPPADIPAKNQSSITESMTKEDDLIQASLTRFAKIQKANLGGPNKVFRKEVFSCLGLGILISGLLLIASMGLKFLWNLIFA